jgi:hypothetical protein
MSRPLLAEHFANSYLLYERCAKVTMHFRRSAGRGAAWLARLTGGQEVGGSNPPGPTSKEPGHRCFSLLGTIAQALLALLKVEEKLK